MTGGGGGGIYPLFHLLDRLGFVMIELVMTVFSSTARSEKELL